jgi:short-subunit dehydrogenase
MNQQDNSMLMMAAAGAGIVVASWMGRTARHYDFRDKTVLITGGSRGLGFVLASEFARAGAKVAICARDEGTLKQAQAKLKAQGIQVVAVTCDVTKSEEVSTLIRVVRKRYGQIDVLVNNAGTITVGPMEVMTLADYEEAMNLHFWAPLNMTLAVLPDMRQRRQGRIVNIASIGGRLSMPHLLPYSASKFALTGLSEGLRSELAKDGVLVTTVAPGLMRTGSPRNASFKGHHRDEYAWFSIGDSLPLLSISAERAAQQIIAATQRGDADITLSLPAKLAVRFHTVFPELTARMLTAVNHLLPGVGGIGTTRALGRESTSSFSPSWLTTLSEHAAQQYNQLLR